MNSSRAKLRDEVYTQMMCAQARLSKDQNTQMGAVLVSADGRVISTGYNGAPAGFDDETVPYTREKQLLAYDLLDADTGALLSHHEFEANKYPFMVHAEINALHYARALRPRQSSTGIEALRDRIPLRTLFPRHQPIRRCRSFRNQRRL